MKGTAITLPELQGMGGVGGGAIPSTVLLTNEASSISTVMGGRGLSSQMQRAIAFLRKLPLRGDMEVVERVLGVAQA